MAFPSPPIGVRTSIGDIDIQLHDQDGSNPGRSISIQAAVLDQDGMQMRDASFAGDLLPHITQTDVSWLLGFLDRIRTKANADLLP